MPWLLESKRTPKINPSWSSTLKSPKSKLKPTLILIIKREKKLWELSLLSLKAILPLPWSIGWKKLWMPKLILRLRTGLLLLNMLENSEDMNEWMLENKLDFYKMLLLLKINKMLELSSKESLISCQKTPLLTYLLMIRSEPIGAKTKSMFLSWDSIKKLIKLILMMESTELPLKSYKLPPDSLKLNMSLNSLKEILDKLPLKLECLIYIALY